MPIKPFHNHYSFENPPTVFDEEAMTALELAARLSGKVNECVEYINEFEAQVGEQITGDVNNWLEAHPEVTTVVHDKSLTEQKLTDQTLLQLKNFHVSPQMFGAAGDGVTDDTAAMLAMIAYIDEKAPVISYENEASIKDYGCVRIQFDGCYMITEPLQFNNTNGLRINHLNLIAGEGFSGEAMIILASGTRSASISNTTINGRMIADACILHRDYGLCLDVSNTELVAFKKYGFKAVDKGHEMKFVNVTIKQLNWGAYYGNGQNLVTEGTGLYLEENRHDNQFTNVIINYCKSYAIEIHSGTNVFVGCHFYGGDVRNLGSYNTFQNCYFDGVHLRTNGPFMLCNNFFMRATGTTEPFIYLLETNANAWRYDNGLLNGNMFKASENVPNAVDLGDLESFPRLNTVSNTFYYVEPFVCTNQVGNAPTPWLRPATFWGDADSGYVNIGLLTIMWGTKAGNDETWVVYPNGLQLAEVYYVGAQRIDHNTDSPFDPYAADLRADRFWLNGIGSNSTARWFAIGRRSS